MTLRIEGIWLPLITPFRDGALDERSLRRMVRHYLNEPIDGMILAATTGEGLTIDDGETERLVQIVAAETNGRIPVYLGLSGSDTRKMLKALDRAARWSIAGYLIACPYYTRPSQEGLFQHFSALAGHTGRCQATVSTTVSTTRRVSSSSSTRPSPVVAATMKPSMRCCM